MNRNSTAVIGDVCVNLDNSKTTGHRKMKRDTRDLWCRSQWILRHCDDVIIRKNITNSTFLDIDLGPKQKPATDLTICKTFWGKTTI